MDKVVVFQTWGTGDVVMSTPVLRALRRKFPNVHISMVVRSQTAAEVVLGSPYCDQALVMPVSYARLRELIQFFWKLREMKLDAAIVGTRLSPLIGQLARYLTKIPVVAGDGETSKPYGYTHWCPIDPAKHRVNANISILELIAGPVTVEAPFFHIDEVAWEEAHAILKQLEIERWSLLGVHPGSELASPVKRIPPKKCAKVVTSFLQKCKHANAIVFFGPDDTDLIDDFRDIHPRAHLVDRLRLRTVAALLAQCRMVVASDSGLGHIAAAFDVPVITIAGPTVIAETRPWGVANRVIKSDEELECQPCWGTELYHRCPYGVRCLQSISERRIIEALEQAFSLNR
jgi:heptosyltransferase-2